MRLMIIGSLNGQMAEAGKIALRGGAKVAHCEGLNEALGALRSGKGADLIMCDVRLDIETLIKALERERFHIPVVGCGIGKDSQAAIRAIKAGAKEFLPLPPDAELIAAVLEAVTEESHEMIAQDPAMQPVIKLAQQIAPSTATVMITGESGTGKEVMARFLHRKSKRSEGPFIALNCAAIPENLLESELFGHEKGAFTGAVARRLGKFEEAHGGTLLLDEISEMHTALQAKLLRAIQERVIDRVGGTEPVKVDVRILATTNRNLEESVRNGDFRQDLYYRLNVVNTRLPALRERPGDIPPLARHFIAKYAEQNGLPAKDLSAEAEQKLLRHDWPGNIRELENTLHRALLISMEDEIEPEAIMLESGLTAPSGTHLMEEGQSQAITDTQGVQADSGPMVGRTVAEVERDLILSTLNHCIGNRTQAANILGISIRTLRNKLNQYREEGVEIPA